MIEREGKEGVEYLKNDKRQRERERKGVNDVRPIKREAGDKESN